MAMTINGGTVTRAAPAVNLNADVILPAVANVNYTIKRIMASYSGALPAAGRIGILSAGVIVWDADLTGQGPYDFPGDFTEELTNTQITIRLFAGGLTVSGKLVVAAVSNNILPLA